MKTMPFQNINAVFLALPTAIVILNTDEPNFTVERVNNAFLDLTEMDSKDWVSKPFFEKFGIYALNGYQKSIKTIQSSVQKVLSTKETVKTEIFEFDLNSNQATDQKNIYLQFKCSPVLNDDGAVDSIILALYDATDLLSTKEKNKSGTQRIKSRRELQNFNEDIAVQAAHNKAQFESASQELDDFVYSVSHDLRAPLRRIDGFSQELLNEYADKLDETGAHYIKRIRQGAQDMGQLIDDLLKLSRISRKSIEREEVDLGEIAKSVFDELMELEPERKVQFYDDENLTVNVDKGLIKAMLVNLISNALKFPSKKEVAEIRIGSKSIDGEKVYYISDMVSDLNLHIHISSLKHLAGFTLKTNSVEPELALQQSNEL